MTRHALLIAAVLLLVACATYRLPGHPHSDGSVTNQVIYAYFALAYETSGTPPAFSQFFLDQDDEVVFVLRLNPSRPRLHGRCEPPAPRRLDSPRFSRQRRDDPDAGGFPDLLPERALPDVRAASVSRSLDVAAAHQR
jgi:hypothetical protein